MCRSVTFSIEAWKGITKMCGSVVSTEKVRPALQRINISCMDNRYKAIGSNGYQISVAEGDCKMSVADEPLSLLIPPIKAPAKTRFVTFTPSATFGPLDVLTVQFFDEFMSCIELREEPVFNGGYPDLENFAIKTALDSIDKENHGRGQYMIVVNPRYLLTALESLKDCNAVVMNFGSLVQPFIIRPYDKEQDRMALVYPVRPNMNKL